MRITRRTAGRLAALAAGIAAAASVAAAVSATAFARTTVPHQAPALAPACRAGALRLSLVGTDTGVGTTALTVAVTNHSTSACTLVGYPSLGLVGSGGAPLPASFSHGSGDWFAGTAIQPVRLAPASQASFFITYRDFNPVTGHLGPTVSALRASLPGVTGQFTVPARFAPYGPVSVSPIRAGARKE